MNYKFLIIDDEPLARKLIISHTSKIECLECAGEFGDAIEAGNHLRTRTVDLLFLDIQMPELGGLEFLRTLRNPPAVIFTTAFREYAPDAFEVDAIDYLIKPIAFERLLKAVNKFFDRSSRSGAFTPLPETDDQRSVLIKADRKMHKIFLDEILYIESLDDYVKIHLQGGVLISRENISTIGQKLSAPSFVRIHRSFIVSAKYISSISSEGLEIKGKLLPFGRAFKSGAMSLLGVRSRS
jgi:two-component system, LytTR family, response regulator LytT